MKYLGYNIIYDYSHDVKQKLDKFTAICGTITRTLKNKTRKDSKLKFSDILKRDVDDNDDLLKKGPYQK